LESMEEMADNCENFNNRIDEINHLIEKLMKLKESINKYKKIRNFWNLRFFSLSMVIWTDQVKYEELQKTEANCRIIICTAIKLIKFKEHKLKNFIGKRKSYFLEQCGQLHVKGSKYADNFWRAQTEYSSESLSKDIKRYQEEYKKTHDELPTLTNKLTNLEILCGLNNPYKETEEVLKMNTVLTSIKENENNKLFKIMSTLKILEKLKEEIQQKKKALNSIQAKKFIIQHQNVFKYKN
ncbi:uncharacterized protein LOC143422678, partial [Xylocopa sonorina]|uniref:uncharacterized protein LOC143422678 n=1 Tax=Xylocopa sonorina TaxID=1818115 RepID=UPI00403AB2A2